MAAIKKSKSEVPAFGEEIARLRTRRDWSRSTLIKRLDRILAAAATDDDKDYSEAWLSRLESGEIVKIPRRIVNALAEALQCTPRERARLLLLADKNILLDTSATVTEVVEVFNYQMLTIYDETCQFLGDLMQDRHLAQLSDAELSEIFLDALVMVIAERHSNLNPKSSSSLPSGGRRSATPPTPDRLKR